MDLKSYLNEANISPYAFSDVLGVHWTTVYRYIHGTMCPSLRMAQRIARETGGAVGLHDFGHPAGTDTPADRTG